MKHAQSCKLVLSAILLVSSIVCSPKVFSADCSIYYLPSMNFDQGPPNGGSPDPYAASAYDGASAGETWAPTYAAMKYQMDFLEMMMGEMDVWDDAGASTTLPALTYDIITFEPSNGWGTEIGDGDRMAGTGAPYAGGAHTSPAQALAGSYADGSAGGKVSYHTADNSVTFELINLAGQVGGDMNGNNDTDRGVNTTPLGEHFLEIPVSETETGGVKITFEHPVPALGMFVMGMEEGKRPVEITLTLANGEEHDGHESDMGGAEYFKGPLDVGGVGVVAYRVQSDDPDCFIKEVSLIQPFTAGDTASMRDIFSIDDLAFASTNPNPYLAQECPEIVFEGELQASNVTAYPFVGGNMFGTIEDGSAAATSITGFEFSSEQGFDPQLFTWTFGENADLTLTDHLSPTSTAGGFELYTSDPNNPVTIQFFYDGVTLATGIAEFIRVEVDNNYDTTAIGKGQATLQYPGEDDRFFYEVMAKTGGAGVIWFALDDFYPTSPSGQFFTGGSATCLGCAEGDGTTPGDHTTPDDGSTSGGDGSSGGGTTVVIGDDDCEDAPVIGEVSFDSDTVGGASAHASLVHSPTLTDWTVVEDAGVKYYESNEDQTNLKIEFTEVTLADGEALRVKVDYQFLSEPTSPGMQHFNFLRFGAYHDQDTTDYGDDEGYLADVSYWKTDTTSGATKSGDYAIRKETNFYDHFDLGPLLDNVSATDYSPPAVIDTGDIVTMGSWTKSADEGITDEHAAVLCLVNDGGVITASLTHAFPIAYIGSVSDTAADSMVTFNTVYLESPSDNNGFRIRRVGVQHVGVDDPCCDPGEPIDPDDPGQGDDCLMVHSEHVDGHAGGDPTSFSYTAAEAEQADFINMVTAMGLTHDTITFEVANGWNPVNGDGDMFAGSGAPYAGGANTSAAYAASGDMASGTAEGKVDYTSAANTVIFELYNNGHAATPPDEPGIGDMDGTNDTDRGINTTLSGNHFLEVLPSDNAAGGLHIKFAVQPVAAVGFYLMGIEETKRDIELNIYLSDGSVVDASADILAGPLDQGGLQFLGYHVSSLSDTDCLIEGLSFHQPTSPDGAAAAGRDIFALDDIIYSIGGDVPHQGGD